MTPEGRQKLVNLLVVEEEYRQFAYKDIVGNLTIGYGHNLDANGLSKKASRFVLDEDIDFFLDEIHNRIKYFPYLTETRKIALISMAYNLGVHGFMGFKRMHLAMESRNWQKAAEEILDSKAAKQLPNRYKRIAHMILHDEYVTGDSYGTA